VPPITWRGWESDRRRLPGVAGRVWRPSTTTVNFARRRNVGRCPAPVRSFSVLQKRAAAGALPSKLSGPMIYYFMVVPSWRRNVEDDGEHSRIRIIRFAERLLRVAVTYGRLPAFLAPSAKRISLIQSKRNLGNATQCPGVRQRLCRAQWPLASWTRSAAGGLPRKTGQLRLQSMVVPNWRRDVRWLVLPSMPRRLPGVGLELI